MYQIVTISDLRLAMLFSDYLHSLGIVHRVIEEGPSATIVVREVTDVERAAQAFQDFAKDPHHPRFRGLSWQNEARGQGAPSIDRYYAERSVGVVDQIRRGGAFTLIVAAVSIVIYILMVIGYHMPVTSTLFFFANAQAMLDPGQWWRWISPVLLHFHPLHILFNVLWWWILAGMVERLQGVARLAWLFLLLAAGSNLAQFMAVDHHFGGLSGVVYGLLGYWWFYGRVRPGPWMMRPAIIVFMLVWLVLGFTGMIGPIANAAHLGGLLIGCLLGVLLATRDKALLNQ